MNRILSTYKDMWTRTFQFKGRSTNIEYWCPFFINVIITLLFIYVFPYPMVSIIYNIAILLPFISLSIRRMHDTNKSGWNILWLYIPTILLVVYAGAILYYTQTPEIVDIFLKFFMAMVIGYLVFLIYSIYLLTHYTYPKKNHYGDVPHIEKVLDDEELLEAPLTANVEETLTFKTKAFLEKAKKPTKKKKETVKEKDTEEKAEEKPEKKVKKSKTTRKKKKEPITDVVVEAVKEEPQTIKETKDIETLKPDKVEKPKTKPIVKATIMQDPTAPRVKTLAEKRAETQQTMSLSKAAIQEELNKTIPGTDVTMNVKPIVHKKKEPVKEEPKEKKTDEIMVKAQLKPTKKRPVKPKAETVETIPEKVEKPKAKPIVKAPVKKEPVEPIVKTLAEKRAESQQTMSISKATIQEELQKTADEMKHTTTVKTIKKPLKRKVIQPVEIPNVNVEKIRTHSLDSIAKLVEQNMTKDPADAPTVVASMKKAPIKRKKKDDDK